jgi:hypothetical protein
MYFWNSIKADTAFTLKWARKMHTLWRHSLRMKLAISLADMKQKAFNRRYHIMLMETPKGEKLVSITREDLNRLKRKKWLPKTFSHLDLEREAFYSTPLALNNKTPKQKRLAALKRYKRYIEKHSRL